MSREYQLSNFLFLSCSNFHYYRDNMKKKAFAAMENALSLLNIPRRAIDRAKMIFAAYRDREERVYNNDEVVSAVLIRIYI